VTPGPRCALTAIACGLFCTDANAQTPPAANQNTTVNLNYVYAASLGFGGYSLAGLTAAVYTLPLADTLFDTPLDGWSLKLLLPIQLGIYNFSRASCNLRCVSITRTKSASRSAQPSRSKFSGCRIPAPASSSAAD